ncbi:MAG TPA: ATP-binding cassette domain-containing protein [Burkholderiaceae bacterium]|nr:ATP-binding cassette domain-containing protein [Burkholderiaceae bacterium]
MSTAALQVTNLHAECSQVQTLNGVSLYAMPGEIVVLLGSDGSGRHATLQAIIGKAITRHGSVRIIGKETIHHDSNEITHLGLGMLPAYGGISPHLTCEENLLLPHTEHDTPGGGMSLSQIYELCPDLQALRNTLGTRLSGAEKRLLAIARMLRTGTSVLLMDDISDGLAPVMTKSFSSLILNLKRQGYTVIIGSRCLDFCTGLADRFYVIENGRITDSFNAGGLHARIPRLRRLLGVGSFTEAH